MTKRGSVAWVSVLALMFTAGCGSSDGAAGPPGAGNSGGSGGATGGSGGATGGSGGATGGSGGGDTGGSGGASTFDPEHPGMRMSFSIGVALLMGQPTTFAAGAFMITGREDLEPSGESPQVPLETCQVTTSSYTPSCAGPQDCAPEQQCVPETDMDGNPIASSEHCATTRSPVDAGQFTITGFASGPKTFAYNSGQNGAYTTPGGDGTVPYEDVAFDTTYALEGNGDASQGLGAFTGEVRLSPELKLTQPEMVALPIGFDGIQVNVNQDLVLAWSGSDPGAEVSITLTGGSTSGDSTTVTCRTADAGTFTIPAAMMQAANLGTMAFLNMLTLERTNAGTATGDGLTSHDISTLQSAVINVAKQP